MIIFLTLCSLCLFSVECVWKEPPPAHNCITNHSIYPCVCTRGSDEGIFVECVNVNLALLTVGLHQATDKLFNTLTVSKCRMKRIFGDVFGPLHIINLVIQDTDVQDVDEETYFGAGQSLKDLRILNTHLSRLPPTITEHTELKILKIEKSFISYIPPFFFKELTSLEELVLSQSSLKDVSESVYSGLSKLKRLTLSYNEISNISISAFQSLINLEYLDLSHNALLSLEPHYFSDLKKLSWLNVSYNAIDSFQSRSFSRNSALRVLNLNGNAIERLDSNSLRGLRFLRRLHLSDNRINFLGRGTFQSISRLGTIELARNNLTVLDSKIFEELRYSELIDVSQNQIEEIKREAFTFLYLATVNLSHNSLTHIPEGAFKNCDNMTVLDMSHNLINNIHTLALDQNTYATEWRLEYNNLPSMTYVPLTYMKGLKVLNVSHNSLVDIPKKTFPNLYELYSIDFSYNQISVIEKSVFSNLFSLRTLNLSHNAMEVIESSTFGTLPTLLDLDLSFNSIQTIRRSSLVGLSSVRSVTLAHNFISEIPTPPISLNHMSISHNNISEIKGRQPWPVMNSLLTLDLDYNNLGDSLTAGRFDGLIVLRTLSLRGNNITKPPYEAFSSLQSLQYLLLDDNHIQSLSREAFGKLPVVFELSLRHNGLFDLTPGAFKGLLQLIKLDLSHNNLTKCSPGVFQSLVSLQDLNLSFNQLNRLDNKTHGVFEDTLSLRSLDLSHNFLSFFSKKMFPSDPWIKYNISSLDLSYNRIPVLTLEFLIGTQTLRFLNLSHNILNSVRNGVLGKMSPNLQVLDLSHNVLSDTAFKEEKVPFFSSMTTLLLHHNKFSHLPLNYMTTSSDLKTLDLRYNNIVYYSPLLTPLVRKQLDVFYEGNPIECGCSFRPIVAWIRDQIKDSERLRPWSSMTCATPQNLRRHPLTIITEHRLTCKFNIESEEFPIGNDVIIRRVSREGSHILASWYVNTREDLADFIVELKLKGYPSTYVFRQDARLTTRHVDLSTMEDVKDWWYSDRLTICVSAKNSLGHFRAWRSAHCRSVNSSMKSMNIYYNMFYTFIVALALLLI